MNYKIEALEYYLPERIIDNDFLEAECGIDKAFIEEKVGIHYRHIAGENESVSDMAVKASNKLFENHTVNKDEIGLILVCTQNPDYNLPTTACLVQDKLGLRKDIIGFDLNLGCSGFVYSLAVAGNFIKTGSVKYALVIMADQYSKILSYKDKNTAPIFGDAATAVLLSPCEDGFGVMDVNFGTDGSGWDKLILHNSGIVKNEEKSNFVYMDGLEIFKFAVRVVPQSIKDLLLRNNIENKDIKNFIFHQANTYIIKELQKRLKLSDDQIIIDMADYGNTVQSTLPIVFKNAISKNQFQKGDVIVFSGYGVGLSWASAIYKFI